MTQADMMNYMGDGAMMENGDAPGDQSSKTSIEHRHHCIVKNHESAERSRARNMYLPCCQNGLLLCNAIFAIVVTSLVTCTHSIFDNHTCLYCGA
uniref:Uncharacterized protein n=1 Tax=Aegilops tauschii subsp. strangulata TaxID=200361 RepID=A0A453FZ75_AEGTS